MYIKNLKLMHYRNYDRVDLSFDNKINIIIGENAQGKTNLLEAIYLLAFTRSYRTSKDKELIQWGQNYGKIEGAIVKRNQQFPLEIQLTSKGKIAKLNHLEQRRLSHYIGAFNIVMFAPEDLNLVKGSPQIRRRFIDMEIGQIQPVYIHHLRNYQKVLRQRNQMLKDLQRKKTMNLTMLEVLTEQLISHACEIIERRFLFLNLLRQWAIPIHKRISQDREILNILYAPTIDVSEDDSKEKISNIYWEKFKQNQTKEIDRGTTLYGPHRDDLLFFINDHDIQKYGSQGQQRTTALSLKLAEIELIKQEIGEYPVLLLDDVLSELDQYRQSHLLDTIQDKVQTFVSTTSVSDIKHKTIEKADLFYVENGQITNEKRG